MNTEIIKAEVIESPITLATNHYEMMVQFVKVQMHQGTDYGVIPGTNDKLVLLKPGAEKLCRLLNLSPHFELVSSITDFDKGLFYYHYRCTVYKHGEPIAQGEGCCNSKEKKYLKKVDKVCPKCGNSTIIKGKADYGGGWVCFTKKGGCNAKFVDGDPTIESQPTGYTDNPEIFDLVNTLCKMAQKRSLLAAVLIAAGASEFFTQDMDDIEPNISLIDQTTAELKRLGWNNERGKLYLQDKFGKSARSQLTQQELQQFLEQLRSLPSVSGV